MGMGKGLKTEVHLAGYGPSRLVLGGDGEGFGMGRAL